MRTLPSNILAHLQARGAQHAHLLVWFQARNRTTGDAETIGFWTGADHEGFLVEGEVRTYLAAGNLLKIPPLVSEVGLSVRTTRLTLSSISEAVQTAVLGYELRQAPCQMHLAYFDPITQQLIDEPVRIFKGFVAGAEISRPEVGGEGVAEISLLSSALALTRTLSLKKSDTALRNRQPNDAFRQYTDVSGSIETVWGEARANQPTPTAAKYVPREPTR
ncbi:hypothetical protein [Pseudosulfitobacter sp. DSM 107133]|uniref:hypothetical protein n=1 Tax=Pseudosulfitobacter sp. DSM 107133 TaxID=2883100 RepID=UPI000DF14DB3|nr:hypothetical protein [Pseudosulfitobacter sp. DSM 107133]UOA25895.1 hypothetical protein DSM107133_00584 [Pseudosulfitobacter sp. DSM 107133]